MKLANVAVNGGVRAASVKEDRLLLLDYDNLASVLAQDTPADQLPVVSEIPLESARLLPPVGQHCKCVCVGLNYASHIAESGMDTPTHPMLFAKFPSALIGPTDDIPLPQVSPMVDWECELAVVIGKRVHRADEREAADAIGGFTLLNDVSVRDWQLHTSQFLPGKSFDAMTPVGPWMVGVDELGTEPDLEVSTLVDGEVMQQARTSDLVFKPAALISYISTFCTLDPGDIIATGTAGGVGHVRRPPVYLKNGQILETAGEGLGKLSNRCIDEPAAAGA
jgi:acylpyruvate hydrolase